METTWGPSVPRSGNTGSRSGESTAKIAQSSTQSMVPEGYHRNGKSRLDPVATRRAARMEESGIPAAVMGTRALAAGTAIPHRLESSSSTQCFAVRTYARNVAPKGPTTNKSIEADRQDLAG